jgi:hypothetical protein
VAQRWLIIGPEVCPRGCYAALWLDHSLTATVTHESEVRAAYPFATIAGLGGGDFNIGLAILGVRVGQTCPGLQSPATTPPPRPMVPASR